MRGSILPVCDFIVVGGSAGAVEGMQQLAHSFPHDLPAAVFMVLHVPADTPSMLPEILNRSGPLPARHPQDREPIRPGHIYVAPSDRHLTIEDGVVRVMRGPRENRHRPAIDPLFRTAARAGGKNVIGVILSGHADDGAAGLRAVRARGGIAMVQDPSDAAAREMPESALKYGGADYVLPVAELGPKLVNLACGRGAMIEGEDRNEDARNVEGDLWTSAPSEGRGTPSVFACPECNGVLWEFKDGEFVRFRCRVGHAYTMANLAEEQVCETEEALWAAMRALEEKAALATRMAESITNNKARQRFLEQAGADRDRAAAIRKMLFADDKEASSADDIHNPKTARSA